MVACQHNWSLWQLVVLREQTQNARSIMKGQGQYEPMLETSIKTAVISARCCTRCGERETK